MMGQVMKASGSGDSGYLANGVISSCSRIRARPMPAASSVPANAPPTSVSPGFTASSPLMSTLPARSTAKRCRYPSDCITDVIVSSLGTGPSHADPSGLVTYATRLRSAWLPATPAASASRSAA